MKIVLVTVSLALLAWTGVAAQNASSPTTKFRLIHGLVLGLDSKPAANRTVRLVGLSRGSLTPSSEDATNKSWIFTTDNHGRFEASFGDFGIWTDKKNRPGWGCYALVVDSTPRDAGAVSPRFWFDTRPNQGRYTGWADNDEWGPVLDLPPEGLSLTLHIQAGITVEGHIWDYTQPDKPIRSLNIMSENNLYAETHTGAGGEILFRNAVTDAKGHFSLKHLYPKKLYFHLIRIDPDFDSSIYWLKTKVSGTWIDDAAYYLMPQPGQSVLHLEIMATPQTLMRYFGKVTDDTDQPIAGAKVTFGMSMHSKDLTWSDYHLYRETLTDKDGHYEIKLGTPWVRGMNAEAIGFKEMSNWSNDDTPKFSPGEYNFTLKKN